MSSGAFPTESWERGYRSRVMSHRQGTDMNHPDLLPASDLTLASQSMRYAVFHRDTLVMDGRDPESYHSRVIRNGRADVEVLEVLVLA